jgi:virulence-associated protein VagC
LSENVYTLYLYKIEGGKMSKKVIRKVTAAVAEERVTTKLFMNGGSQAVRIPAKWKFESDTVELTFDPETHTIRISSQTREEAKAAFIALVKSLTEEEREEIKNWKLSRDLAVPTVRPEVAEFFKDKE